jgi:ATP-dependent Clp protease ATP-binding subunit ClpA
MINSSSLPSPLERYGQNLTALAHKGTFSPLSGHDAEVTYIFQVLLRPRKTSLKCNPLLLGRAGGDRLLVINEVARRIACGEAPEPLRSQQIVALNYEALLEGLDLREIRQHHLPEGSVTYQTGQMVEEPAQWDALARDFKASIEMLETNPVYQRLGVIFAAVRQSANQVILFVDYLHRLLGAEPEACPVAALDLLKSVLIGPGKRHNSEIQVIGACSFAEYQQFIRPNGVMRQRFQEVGLSDMSSV